MYFISDNDTKAFIKADQSGRWQYIASSLNVGKHRLEIQVSDETAKIEGKRFDAASFSILPATAKQSAALINQSNYTVIALITAVTLITIAIVVAVISFMRSRRVVSMFKSELQNRYPASASIDPEAYAAYANKQTNMPAYPSQQIQPSAPRNPTDSQPPYDKYS